MLLPDAHQSAGHRATILDCMALIDSLTAEEWSRRVSESNSAAMRKSHKYPCYEASFLKNCCDFQKATCAVSCFCRKAGCQGIWSLARRGGKLKNGWCVTRRALTISESSTVRGCLVGPAHPLEAQPAVGYSTSSSMPELTLPVGPRNTC